MMTRYDGRKDSINSYRVVDVAKLAKARSFPSESEEDEERAEGYDHPSPQIMLYPWMHPPFFFGRRSDSDDSVLHASAEKERNSI